MGKYLVKRILLLIPTLFLVCLIVFALMRLVPGSAVDIIASQLSSTGSTIDRAAVEAMLGLDKPFWVQFATYMGDLLHGDLGTSIFDARFVWTIIKAELPITLELAVMILVLTTLISIPLGLVCAAYQDSISDNVIRVISVIMMSVPVFWVATLILVYPAVWWGYAPPVKYVSLLSAPLQNMRMFLPPALIGAFTTAGAQLRNVRTLMLEELRKDYVRTAWSKGLKERSVLFVHAFRNTLIPVITQIGGSIGALLGGSVVLETLFNIPGIGLQLTNSLSSYDYPVVQGCVLILAIISMIVTLIVDVAYKWADPRVTLE